MNIIKVFYTGVAAIASYNNVNGIDLMNNEVTNAYIRYTQSVIHRLPKLDDIASNALKKLNQKGEKGETDFCDVIDMILQETSKLNIDLKRKDQVCLTFQQQREMTYKTHNPVELDYYVASSIMQHIIDSFLRLISCYERVGSASKQNTKNELNYIKSKEYAQSAIYDNNFINTKAKNFFKYDAELCKAFLCRYGFL